MRPAIVWLAGAVLCASVPLFPARAHAQAGVTLPSIRATGPSPTVRRLLAAIESARGLYDPNVPAEQSRAQALDAWLRCVARAPFTRAELEQARSAGGATGGLQKISRGVVARSEGPRLQSVLDARTTATLAAEQTTPITVLCNVTEISEEYTGRIAEQLREAGERDELRLAIVDTTSMIARLAVIERKLRTRMGAPVRSYEQARAFWRQQGFQTLGIGSVSGSGQQGAAFTELAAPFIHSVRVSVNSVLAVGKEGSDGAPGAEATPLQSTPPAQAADEEAGSDAAITRFLNGGGLVNVAFTWPAFRAGIPNGAADALVLIAPRLGATLPALGANIRDSTLLYDAGVETHLKSSDAIGGAGVFLQTRIALAGGTGRFAEQLGLGEARQAHFGYMTLTTGLQLGTRYLITAGRTLAGPRSLRQLGWQVGVTAVRTGQ